MLYPNQAIFNVQWVYLIVSQGATYCVSKVFVNYTVIGYMDFIQLKRRKDIWILQD
jgi:hypothetical protein